MCLPHTLKVFAAFLSEHPQSATHTVIEAIGQIHHGIPHIAIEVIVIEDIVIEAIVIEADGILAFLLLVFFLC